MLLSFVFFLFSAVFSSSLADFLFSSSAPPSLHLFSSLSIVFHLWGLFLLFYWRSFLTLNSSFLSHNRTRFLGNQLHVTDVCLLQIHRQIKLYWSVVLLEPTDSGRTTGSLREISTEIDFPGDSRTRRGFTSTGLSRNPTWRRSPGRDWPSCPASSSAAWPESRPQTSWEAEGKLAKTKVDGMISTWGKETSAPSTLTTFTVDSLPPNHQAGEAQEEEDAAQDGLPLGSLLLHLRVGLAEHQAVHCRDESRDGEQSSNSYRLSFFYF